MTNAISSGKGLSSQQRMSPNYISEREQSQGNSKLTSKAFWELTVQPSAHGLQVVHATPGRLRLRATDSSIKSILDTISQQLRQQDGVREVSTNQQTGSLVVTFDENKLSLPQMFGVLQQFGVSEPQASLPEEEKTDPFAAWKSLDFWKEQGLDFIPLITGLVVTGRLGIHGLAALPVYLITAGATRQVIDRTRGQGSGIRDQGEERFMPLPPGATNNTRGGEYPAESGRLVPDPRPLAPRPFCETSDNATQSSKITYSVVHAIPGRIRFNVPRIAQDQGYARRLERLLNADALVTSVRANSAAASIIITYKSDVIPVSHWVGLIQLADEASVPTNLTTAITEQPLQEQVSQPTVPIDSTTATPEAASPWAELKPPALSASLAFMANLCRQFQSEETALEESNGCFKITNGTAPR